MQTFLPLPDFVESLRCLDDKRLGNQVYREALTLLNGGWPNHPASKMWKGHANALKQYILVGCQVLAERGTPVNWLVDEMMSRHYDDTGMPWWLGKEDFHASHRSNLLRKDPDYYGQFGWDELPGMDYYWPKMLP